MFARYRDLVLQDYEKKKAAGVLPDSLVNPTLAGLRDLCMTICRDRFDVKDESDLKEFFGKGGNAGVILEAIDRIEIGKFKPLENLLKKGTRKPDRKVIKLLAWLIDFKGRPYDYNKKYEEVEQEAGTIPETDQEILPAAENPASVTILETGSVESGYSRNSSWNNKGNHPVDIMKVEINQKVFTSEMMGNHVRRSSLIKKWESFISSRTALLLLFLLLISSVVIYFFSGKSASAGGCMYWAGDHYEPVSCQPRMGDTVVVALDSQKLKYFKKINQPETITFESIGQIWYVKYRNNIEYYTSHGWRPTEPRIRLKPLSPYMYEKYILPLQQTGRVSDQ
ncbi:MAG: hypothetical protein ACTHMC_02670 [Pseudobacter sp.]|uniref:hypothetical protein n=1 Tax=Pseudobacter sp. TaxID=2045420 RepID=UPI003F7F224B